MLSFSPHVTDVAYQATIVQIKVKKYTHEPSDPYRDRAAEQQRTMKMPTVARVKTNCIVVSGLTSIPLNILSSSGTNVRSGTL